jgi:hypothetical protein
VKKANFANLDDLVDFCFHGIGGLVKPLQVREEILGLLKILKAGGLDFIKRMPTLEQEMNRIYAFMLK